MKRSEMVEHIAEAFLKLYGGDKEEREEARASSKMKRLQMAKIALDSVEKNGMLPPHTDWLVNNCSQDMHWDVVHDYHMWEPK